MVWGPQKARVSAMNQRPSIRGLGRRRPSIHSLCSGFKSVPTKESAAVPTIALLLLLLRRHSGHRLRMSDR